jgi:hypothetical protein
MELAAHGAMAVVYVAQFPCDFILNATAETATGLDH